MEIEKMTEKEFLEKCLKKGWDKASLLSHIAEERQYVKDVAEMGEINFPLEAVLALSYEMVFKDGPCPVETYPLMPPVEELA